MRSVRRRDAQLPAGGGGPAVDGSAFDGCWLNTADRPRGLARLTIEHREDGARVSSLDPEGGRIDWLPDSFRAYSDGPASARPTALVASCEPGPTRGRLEGSLNLGLLVLAVYRRGRRGQAGCFSREFFLRVAAPPAEQSARGPASTLFPQLAEGDPAALEPFWGRWQNTEAGSPGIARITIEDGGPQGPLVEAGSEVGGPGSQRGPRLEGWGVGQTEAFSTVDETGVATASLLTTYRLGFMSSWLQLRVTGGALVLANFTEFHDDSGRRPYFTREFYRRRRVSRLA